MSAQVLTYVSLFCSIVALILGVFAIFATNPMRRWKKFFGKTTTPENLDDVLEQIIEKIQQLDVTSKQTEGDLQNLATQLNTATQHVGVIRYNSNGDDGGNLSFSVAFLDAKQNGLVLTSLHGRSNNRIYTKVVTNGASESTLSEEEREAILSALTSNKNI